MERNGTYVVSVGSLVKHDSLNTQVDYIPFISDHEPITWDSILRQVTELNPGWSGSIVGALWGLTESRV